MFVLGKTAREWKRMYYAVDIAHRELLRDWNALVSKINAKGGAAFLNGNGQTQISEDDIERLLMLCHPDKHGGKKMAEEMTQKLLSLRKPRKPT